MWNSQIPKVLALWKEDLKHVNQRAAEALADPSEYEDLFPNLSLVTYLSISFSPSVSLCLSLCLSLSLCSHQCTYSASRDLFLFNSVCLSLSVSVCLSLFFVFVLPLCLSSVHSFRASLSRSGSEASRSSWWSSPQRIIARYRGLCFETSSPVRFD